MSSGNVFERFFRLMASILKMVVDGVRDLKTVCDMLQTIVDSQCGSTEQQLASWQAFYQKFFGLTLDLSNVMIPERRPGFDRLIVVAAGLTPNRVFEVCQQNFPCWRYTDDLDAATKGRNDREPDQTYAIWVRDRQEADEELKNLSADDHREKKTPTETLLERLLHELKYWSETGQHLDRKNWTLCSGSRGSGGSVPDVGWSGDRLRVDWGYSGSRFGSLRSRAAVPCQS